MLTSVGKLICILLASLIVMCLNVFTVHSMRTVATAMGAQQTFVEDVVTVTCELIIVAKRTLYPSVSSTHRSSSSLRVPKSKIRYKGIRTWCNMISTLMTQQVEKVGIAIDKILSPKRRGENPRRNFGKKRRKQSGGYAYKLRKMYTQSSTTEFRRMSSKNEGARKFCEVTNESVLIRRLVQRYTRVSIYLKGKLTRVASNIAKIAKPKCANHPKGPKMKNDLRHGKSHENLDEFQSKTKNEGAVSSQNSPFNKPVLSVNPEGWIGRY